MMKRINFCQREVYRAPFDTLNANSKIARAFACAGLAVFLASCVSADQNLGLSSSENSQSVPTPAYAVIAGSDGNTEYTSVDGDVEADQSTATDGTPVPVRSPKQNAVADNGTGQAPTPVLAVAEQNSEQAPAGNVIDQSTQADSSTEQAVETADDQNAQDAQDGQTELASLETQEDVHNKPQPVAAPQKQGLLQRLFASNSGKKTAKQPRRTRTGRGDDSIRVANAHTTASKRRSENPARKRVILSRNANSSASASSLPGVKSGDELFGINNGRGNNNTTQVAAVGSFGRLSPNGLRVQHDKVEVACLKPGVLRILKIVERRYGAKPIITSGYRSPKRNRRAGGARNSQHIYCKAVDIQVEGVSKWELAKFLRTVPGRGGVGTYCRTKSVHFDIGSVRDWHHPCRRGKVKRRKKA